MTGLAKSFIISPFQLRWTTAYTASLPTFEIDVSQFKFSFRDLEPSNGKECPQRRGFLDGPTLGPLTLSFFRIASTALLTVFLGLIGLDEKMNSFLVFHTNHAMVTTLLKKWINSFPLPITCEVHPATETSEP